MGQKTYVIGDIHGQFELLKIALKRVYEQTQEGSMPHTIVFLGDYVDRGRDSWRVVDRLMQGSMKKSGKWIFIQGNHEVMMINSVKYGKNASMWLSNGGVQTLLGYGAKDKMPIKEAMSLVPTSHINWMLGLPILHVDKHRVYVHAWIDRDVMLYHQRPSRVQWELWSADDDAPYGDLHIVHGHEQIEDGPVLLDGRTNLDTGAYYTGRLVVGVFDDDVPGGPIGLMEVRA